MKTALPSQLPLRKAIRKAFTLTAVGVTSSVLHTTALAGPDGGQVVDGDAVIEQSNSNTTIRQNSRRTVIDWRDFSIDSHESVDFIQPDSGSVALNRVRGNGRSYIDGALTANGKVFILNGNGIVFGKNAKVDVGGLLATTNDIRNEDFMRGNFDFNIPGKQDAAIYNYGSISVAEGGLAAFVAPYVENNGLIFARYGRVALGAGYDGFALDLYGDELIRLAVSDEFSERLGLFGVSNEGRILAEAGSILLTAETASEVLSDIITVGGEVRADSVGMQNGSIVLSGVGGEINIQENANVQASGGTIEVASASVFIRGSVGVSGDEAGEIDVESGWINVAGSLEASGSSGGSITLRADDIFTSGEISALGELGEGGSVDLHASESITQTSSTRVNTSGQTNGGHIRMTADEQITTSAQFQADGILGDGGNIDVSAPAVKSLSAQFLTRGDQQGGRVRLGGAFQGGKGQDGKDLTEDELPNAETLVVSSGSNIDVSSGLLNVATGSNLDAGGEVILWSDEYTVFQGRIDGPGAFAEISSAGSFSYSGEVNIGDGKLLLDPKNIVIVDGSQPTTLNLILGFGYDYDETSLEADDAFGSAVALDGTHLAVGAPGDDGSGNGSSNSGAVYLYTFSNTDLDSPSLSNVIGDGYGIDSGSFESGDQLGYSLDLDGNLLAIGAVGDDGFNNPIGSDNTGAVYLYSFTGDFASFTLETVVGDEYGGFGAAENLSDVIFFGDDRLGSAVAVDNGGLLAIGQDGEDGGGTDRGAVYLFSFSGDFASLTRESALGNYPNPNAGYVFEYFPAGPDLSFNDYLRDFDYFGSSLALDGNLLAVGARGDDGYEDGSALSGSVYLYSFTGNFDGMTTVGRIGSGYSGVVNSDPVLAQDYDNTDLVSGDEFGSSLALEGTDLYVGAPEDQSGRGAVYAYSFTGSFTSITDEGRYGDGFVGPNDIDFTLESGDNFGRSLSVDGDFLAIGASGDDGAADGVSASGAAYVISPNRFRDDPTGGVNFGDDTGLTSVIVVSDLTTLLDAGTSVTLQASNDITVETAVAVDNAGGDGGAIVMQAGRSITVEDDITTDNGDITLVANETAANAVVDADRDAGDASITFTSGSTINAGTGAVTLTLSDGAGNTENAVGSISLDAITAGSLTISNANTGSSVSDNAALIISGTTDINAAGADVTFDFATSDFDSDDSGDAFTIDAAIAEIFDVNALEIGTSNVTSLVAESGANLTLSGTVTASGDLGDGNDTAIVLAAGANFIEEAASDLVPGAGRFIVYSANPGSDTLTDLTATPWYNTTYDSGNPANVSGTGNRFAYSQTATLTVTADDQTREYGDANPTFTQTITGYVNSETSAILSGSAGNASSTATVTTAAGSETITATAGTIATDRNYTITTANGTLTIDPRDITVTADDRNRVYGSTLALGSSAFSVDDMANGETIGSVTLTSSGSIDTDSTVDAGAYVGDIVPSAATGGTFTASNYDITYAGGDFTVTAAGLTVTAADDSQTYNAVGYSGGNGVTYSGFLNGDTDADLGGALSYAGDSQGATNVGTYTITPQGLTSGNYTITFVDGSLDITAAALTVTADDRIKTYGDNLSLGTSGFTTTGLVGGETIGAVTLTSTSGNASDTSAAAGPYAGDIVPSAATGGTFTASNYTITYANGDLTINPAALTVTATGDTKTYDGLAYSDGNGVTYSGFVNSETDAVLSGTLSYAGDSQGAVNVGGYTITPQGLTSGNYTITFVDGSLTITQAPLTITANNDSKPFDGAPYAGGNGVTYTGFVNSETEAVLSGALTYGGDSQGAINSGSYTITPGGLSSGNYAITFVNGTLSVGLTALTITAIDDSKVYDGLAYSGGNGVSYSGFTGGDDESVLGGALVFLGASQGATGVGSYDITPSGLTSANYAITFVNGNLDVTPASLLVTASDDSVTYNGLSYSGGNGVSFSGFVNAETSAVLGGALAFGGDSQGATNSGAYTITPSGLTSSNYSITFVDGALNISPADLTITAANDAKNYDGLAYSGGNGVAYSGFVNSETEAVLSGALVFGGDSQGAANAGSYTITASGLNSGNYNITFVDGALTISPTALTVTANDDTQSYSGAAYSGGNGVTYSGFVNGETESALTGSLIFGGSSQGATDAGSYVISSSGLTSGNYTISFVDGGLTISPAALTVTANDQVMTYNGSPYSGGNGLSYSGFVGGESEGVLAGSAVFAGTSQGAQNVGTYTIGVSGLTSGNYSISFVDGTLQIDPASLTVTAVGDTKTYDGIAYSGGNGVSYSGFVASEDETVLGGSLNYSGSSQSASDAGSYVLSPEGLTSTNYNITFVDNSLTITPAALVVFASNQIKTYGENLDLGTGGFTTTGLVVGDAIDSVVLASDSGNAANGSAAVGMYSGDISVSGAVGSAFNENNYSINYQAGDLEINPANLTVTAAAQSRIYGDTADLGSSGFSATGLANGEVIDSVSLSSATGIATDASMGAGTYAGEILAEDATGTGFDANNYSITYQAADFTVDPRAITFDAVEDSKELGQLDPEVFNVRPRNTDDLVNGDSLESVTGEISRTEGEGAGQYDILIAENGVNSANYEIEFNSNNNAFTITTGAVVPPPPIPENPIEDGPDPLPEELEVNVPPVVIDRDDVNTGTVVITVDEDSQVVGAIVLPEGNGEVVIQTETKAPIQARPRTSRFARHSKKKKSKASEPVVITSNVVVEKDGSLTIELSDGRRIGGITTPAAKFSEKGLMLILERDRGIASSPAGLATTISVVEMPKGNNPSFVQHMLLFDEIDQMMLLNFDGAGRPPLKPGKSKARVKFGLIDSQGNPINFIAIVTENGVMVRPQSETAKWLSQGSDDIVPSLALLALQTQLDINLDDVVAVYLVR